MNAGWWVLVGAGVLAVTAAGVSLHARIARTRAHTAFLAALLANDAPVDYLEAQFALPARTPEHERRV